MIYQFDICALFIILLFLGSLLFRRNFSGHAKANKIMLVMVVLMLFAIIGDMGSAIISEFGTPCLLLRILMYVSNYIYFLCYNGTLFAYIHYLYASIDIWHVYENSKYSKKACTILGIVDLAVLLLNGYVVDLFSVTEDLIYTRGPWLIVLYVVAGILGTWGILLIIKFRKIINRDKGIVLCSLFPLILSGIIIQFFYSHLLIEMFLMSIALLFFMVVVKREENQIDPITGAIKYNEGIVAVTRSFKTHKPVSVVLVKIMNYSNIRLHLGQDSYNEFLRASTLKLREIADKEALRSEIYYLERGLYAILADGSDLDSAKNAGEMAKEYFEKPIYQGNFEIMTEARVLVVRCPQDIEDFSHLFTLGTTFHDTIPDAKGVIVYNDYKENREFKLRNEMGQIIERALKEGGFEMYYQPIYSTTQRRYVSAEALIRLKDKEYGLISPALFIPVAEADGSIHQIGDFVINEVISFIERNDLEKMGLKYIEMNMSAAQCIEVDLVDKIKGLLESKKVSPEKLSLELTETAADINPAIVDANIQQLHDFGVRIALDDYGTGYSNIKRVTALPIDQVKLDKSFVDMMDDPQMWIVIQDTINMLKEMGKEILVEGVEKEEIAKKFTDLDTDLFLGCELIQGFYFCEPLPENKFIEFINNHFESFWGDLL